MTRELLGEQAQELQRHLKRHHVRLRYSDTEPFAPSSSGTCLHPMPPPPDTADDLDTDFVLVREDARVHDAAMQYALLEDAAMQAAQPANLVGFVGLGAG